MQFLEEGVQTVVFDGIINLNIFFMIAIQSFYKYKPCSWVVFAPGCKCYT